MFSIKSHETEKDNAGLKRCPDDSDLFERGIYFQLNWLTYPWF